MGPLSGLRVIELQGIGPGPFCAMMLADMGAEVIRVDRRDGRLGLPRDPRFDVLARGRRSLRLDLKHPRGVEALLRLVERADGLIEGYRPGVIERLGLGPDALLRRNPRLVVGRMTGWGQQGPLAQVAGHDINYISLAGALFNIGAKGGPPVPPLNLVGDFGGGGMLLAFGMVCGILQARASGRGQVVDAAMVDGAAVLCASFFGQLAARRLREGRGTEMINGGSHFYGVFECADGEHVSIASLEPQFYAELSKHLGLPAEFAEQMDRSRWPDLRAKLAAIFATRTRDEWVERLQQTDICFAPVLRFAEALDHPHNLARGTFVELDGIRQPGPAPRFSATPAAISRPPARPGEHTDEILRDWGFRPDEVAELHQAGAIAGPDATPEPAGSAPA